jgi:hypothetical protein
MTIFYLLLLILGIAAVIGCLILILNADSIQQERCERFRQEKLKEGWSEEIIDCELLSSRFMFL